MRRNSLLLRVLAFEVDPRAQYLSDAPSLREAAARIVRCVAIKYLADRPHAGAVEVLRHGREERLRERRIAIHAVVSPDEGAQQPAPDGAHVVSGIALLRASQVSSDKPRFLRAQAAQPVAGQKFAAAAINHGAHLLAAHGG